MSDQSKYYDYYMVEGDDVKELISSYDTINEQRNSILPAAAEQVGAIAWTTTRNWGGRGGLLQSFVWEKGYEFPCQITIKREDFWNGKRVVIARGKGNTKEGRAYNKELDAVIHEANVKLKALPEWNDYIANHYGIMRIGIGCQSGRGFGFAMLSTYGGKHPQRDDCLIFAIPNNKEEQHGEVVIPDAFKKITYGQFYDIANAKEDEEETAE
ncbi:Eac protein [Salmonella enterica subsp. enterica serovar Corvallis]|uniref:Eac protein n=1 Tax=Salmonella enterica subsp. enterica serovar Altona TaxID=1151173 RepID=A0A5J0HVV6_SALET|nr:Eac protein [Salmonella enterica subsp. enterica serovar Altona]EAA6137435.1 Eac protein [Salmonella enterica subsp. enterica serovar Corvallis]EAY3326853.1 Eac protein [Salmonella enterica subsp. enterica serovar Typhimurium]EDJ1523883.1 Eac protein [Salmonella enterica]EEJ2867034.1 Eac protein [Salmonella enterica subsp. enterica]